MDHTSAILERLTQLHPRAIDLTLGRLEALLAKMGHPEQHLPPTIHLAGTNGKGSTAAFIRAILEADGKAVHVYSSPHLVRFHERIRLGQKGKSGRFVDDPTLVKAMLEVEQINNASAITQFEITTAIAFKLFADHPADVLLLEVGLGGRYDATNVIDHPLATVITSISKDHENFFGSDLANIAREKAGILKPNIPAITTRHPGKIDQVIKTQAQKLGAPLHQLGSDFDAYQEYGRMVFQNEDTLLDLPLPNLIGHHQIDNATLAIATLQATQFAPSKHAIEHGLTHAVWPARLQLLKDGQLVKNSLPDAEIWLDGGHNPAAGQAVAQTMAALQNGDDSPLYLITGLLNTKDPYGFFKPFANLAHHVYTVPVPGAAASFSAEHLAAFATKAGLETTPAQTVKQALNLIRANTKHNTSHVRVLICGSLYLAGDVLKENGTPPA